MINRLWRVFANHLATAAAVGATIVVMAPLIAIFGYLLYKGTKLYQSSLLYPNTQARG